MYTVISLLRSSRIDSLPPADSGALHSCAFCDTGSYSTVFISRSGSESVSDSISLSPSLRIGMMHLFTMAHILFKYLAMPVMVNS